MTTVYLVSDGYYSDYCVLGIYSTSEKAEEAKKLFVADNDVAEFILDKMPEHPPGLFFYQVAMNFIGSASPHLTSYDHFKGLGLSEWAIHTRDPNFSFFYVWAKDETHAVKIANEKRVQLIASGQWRWSELGSHWQLDGKECTQEIVSLLERDFVQELNDHDGITRASITHEGEKCLNEGLEASKLGDKEFEVLKGLLGKRGAVYMRPRKSG